MINFQRTFYQISFVTIILTLLCCCTLSTTRTKVPIFSKSNDSISRDINSIILTEEINLHGEEITSNNKTNSELTVNLINPQALPNDTSERNEIGKQIAELLKQLLKNPDEFDFYKVLFVNRKIDGTVTKSTYTGKIYESKNLLNRIYMVSLGDELDSSTFRAIGKTTFTNQDSEIISGLKYYYASPYSKVTLKMYKETDSGSLFLTERNIGQIMPDHNYIYNKLKVADFYKISGLGSGNYQVEYLLNDSSVGTKTFQLK